MITSILEYLESSASRYPDKTAFADLDATCTFEELRLRARRVGTALAEHFAPRIRCRFLWKKCGYHRYVYGGCLCWMFLCAS